MPVLDVLRSVFGSGSQSTIHECRDCGTTLEAAADRCPECGSPEIAVHRLRDPGP